MIKPSDLHLNVLLITFTFIMFVQIMNGRATVGSQNDRFVGKGHVFAEIIKESLKIRMRTERANEIELERLARVNKIIDKEQRLRDSVLDRVRKGTEKHLEDLSAYRKVLGKEYKVSNFASMKKEVLRDGMCILLKLLVV